jgi:hypothetical protein
MRAFVIPVSVAALVALGCSGTDPGNVFQGQPPPDPPDAGPPPGNFGGDDSGSPQATPQACSPADMSGFQSKWTAPQPWQQNVCTKTQIDGFYTACLTAPVVAATCQAYVAQNQACSACLQSQETDPAWGVVVWHEQMHFWTVNVAGCLAHALGDMQGTGCAGAYEGAIQCRQVACNACWDDTANTFTQFAACESQAAQSSCAPADQAVPSKCGNLSAPPGSECVPAQGATAHDAYVQVAPLFCGPPG